MTYKEKRAIRGGDTYGDWKEGVQRVTDRIAGRALHYDHQTGEWKSNG